MERELSSEKQSGELKWIPIDQIEPNTFNTQVMDPEEFNLLCDQIAEVGFIAPIEVIPMDTGKHMILGGEHRWRAAKTIGLTELPCMVLTDEKWKDEDLTKFVSVRLNVIHGKLDPEKFIKLYNEMVDKYGADSLQRLMGFSDKGAFDKLVSGVKKGVRKGLPKALQVEFDKAAKEVETVEDLSKIVQAIFQKHGDTLSQNFLVFSYGGKNHIYISMNPSMKKAVDKVIEYCRKSGEDINDFMEPITKAYMGTAETRLKRMAETAGENEDQDLEGEEG